MKYEFKLITQEMLDAHDYNEPLASNPAIRTVRIEAASAQAALEIIDPTVSMYVVTCKEVA